MVFSTNQVRHLYVVKAVADNVAESAAAGTIAAKKDAEGKHVSFLYKGADNLMRSDLINLDNILWVKAVSPTDPSQVRKLKTATITLNPAVNEGLPVGGEDYVLRISVNPYIGMSDEEPYFKYGMVHATKDMTAGAFYAKLAASIFKNFSKEPSKLISVTINGKVVDRVKTAANGDETLIDATGAAITVADEYTAGVTITEVEQEWTLGIKEQTNVNFTVASTNITYEGDEVLWGAVTEGTASTTLNNGKKIADLEYFCMGERGDVYRNVGWPNSIPTKYLVDPTAAYYVLDIHYAYVGPNEGPQKSEKDITLVCSDKTVMNSLITKITAAGIKGVESFE